MYSVQRVNRTFRLKVRTDIPLTQKLSLSTHLGTQRRQSNELHANQMKRIVLMMLPGFFITEGYCQYLNVL